MKERPEPNYSIDVRRGAPEPIVGFDAFLPGAISVTVNHVMNMVIIPWLSPSPWPPPYPADWERVRTREEAAYFALATHDVAVAPSSDGSARVQLATYSDAPDSPSTAIWLPAEDHLRLVTELAAERFRIDPKPRLFDLEGTAVADLLRRYLPRVPSLDAYSRRILCLPSP